MQDFELKQGQRYRATLTLGLLEQIADNEMIAAEFRKRGFIDVMVDGNGPAREAVGVWNEPNARIALPSQVVSVTELPA